MAETLIVTNITCIRYGMDGYRLYAISSNGDKPILSVLSECSIRCDGRGHCY